MARIWQTGAELGSTAAEGGSSGLVVAGDAARTGSYGYRQSEVTTTAVAMSRNFLTERTTSCFLRAYVRVTTLPGGNTGILGIGSNVGSSKLVNIRITPTGSLQMVNLSGAQVGSVSSALTLNVWYRVELMYTATATGAIEARIDGSVFASANSPSHTPGWSRIYIGNSFAGTGSGLIAHHDDVAVNDSSGSAQNGYPGPGNIVHVHPAGTGSSNQWHQFNNAAGNENNWSAVSDVIPDDANNWLRSSTLNETDAYAVGAMPVSVAAVNVVAVGVRRANDTASAVSAFTPRIQKASGGTVAEGSPIVPNATAWATDRDGYALATYTDPDGAAWTASTLASMQIGMRLSAVGTSECWVTAIWASVDAVLPLLITGVSASASVSGIAVVGRVVLRASAASAAATGLAVTGIAIRAGALTSAALSTVAVDARRTVNSQATVSATVALTIGAAVVKSATTSASASATLTTAASTVRVGAAQLVNAGDVVSGGGAIGISATQLASVSDVVGHGVRAQLDAVAIHVTSTVAVAALRLVSGSVVVTGASSLHLDAVLAGSVGGAAATTTTSTLDAVGLVVGQGPSPSSASAALTVAAIAVGSASAQLAAACAVTVDVRVVHGGHVDVTSASAITVNAAGAAQPATLTLTMSSAVTATAARVRVGTVSAAAMSSIVARTSNVIRRPADGTIRRPGSAWRVASVVCRARGDVHVG